MNQTMRRVLENAVVIGLFVLLSGLIAVYFGKDLSWDLANYHFYNPFSYLHNRSAMDVWPYEFVHVYFAPTFDFLTYFLITYTKPLTAVFLMGAIHGLNFWLVFCIAKLLLSSIQIRWTSQMRTVFAFMLACLGIFGPTVLPGLGTFQQDELASIFVLANFYCVMRYLQNKNEASVGWMMVAGVFLGAGIGGKLTTSVFLVGECVALLLVSMRWHVRVYFLVGVIAGWLLMSGYWMAMMWYEHHNPLYPLLNGIFHSPDFPAYDWKDNRFLPFGIKQYLFFPFYYSWSGNFNTYFRDIRYPVLYVLFVIAMGKTILMPSKTKMNDMTKWLVITYIISFVFWQGYFAVFRYIAVLEMLAPLMIYILLSELITKESLRLVVFSVICGVLIITMIPQQMVRLSNYSGTYFNLRMPCETMQIKSAWILMPVSAYALSVNPRPQQYLIPFFPSGWHVAGVPFQDREYRVPTHLSDKLKNQTFIYLLASKEHMKYMRDIAARFAFNKMGKCYSLKNDRQLETGQDVWLCRVLK